MEIKVGDVLFDYSLKGYEITKVGRKWLYTKSYHRELKVEKETLRTESDYRGENYQLYSSKKEVENIRKLSLMQSTVTAFFRDSYRSGSGLSKISDLDLEEVYEIISKYK